MLLFLRNSADLKREIQDLKRENLKRIQQEVVKGSLRKQFWGQIPVEASEDTAGNGESIKL